MSRYQKIHSPFTHTYHDHQPSFIRFLHLLRYIASFLFNLRARQSSCPVCLRVHFGLPLRLESSASYSIHFFTQSSSSFRNTRRYHRNQVNSVRQLPSYCNAEFSRDEWERKQRRAVTDAVNHPQSYLQNFFQFQQPNTDIPAAKVHQFCLWPTKKHTALHTVTKKAESSYRALRR